MTFNERTGLSLTEVLIAVTLLTVLGSGLVRLLSASTKSAQSAGRLVDLKTLSQNFAENVECQQT